MGGHPERVAACDSKEIMQYPKDSARLNAEKHFAVAGKSVDTAKQAAAQANAASDANTLRLRTLRLEKEQADKRDV
jgi:hypothetical protein